METFQHVTGPGIFRIHHNDGEVVPKLGRILGCGSRSGQVSQTKITTFKVVYHIHEQRKSSGNVSGRLCPEVVEFLFVR